MLRIHALIGIIKNHRNEKSIRARSLLKQLSLPLSEVMVASYIFLILIFEKIKNTYVLDFDYTTKSRSKSRTHMTKSRTHIVFLIFEISGLSYPLPYKCYCTCTLTFSNVAQWSVIILLLFERINFADSGSLDC